jgi:hypothetical protein
MQYVPGPSLGAERARASPVNWGASGAGAQALPPGPTETIVGGPPWEMRANPARCKAGGRESPPNEKRNADASNGGSC